MRLQPGAPIACRTCATITTDYRWSPDGYRTSPDCRACHNLAIQAWRHGLKPARLLAMIAAGCAACGATASWRWHIDHAHDCCPGQKSCGSCVRGLLCAQCNLSAGHAGDDPARLRRLADYLEARGAAHQ